ncbi:hypothetical protein [Nonomuraea sp. JJY05]|uniref:hypothetical protein n=1 Tax=Nonomuraea sp. JJY05 TaxID=3350255 RepID=UPI00373E4D4C
MGRTAAESEWRHAIARHAAGTLPEAVVPVPDDEPGVRHDADDLEYHRDRVALFRKLRP